MTIRITEKEPTLARRLKVIVLAIPQLLFSIFGHAYKGFKDGCSIIREGWG